MGNSETKLLSVPAVGKVECNQDFIQTAVCELRIPTVLELDTISPNKFAKAIKRDYPVYTRGQNIALNIGSGPAAQGISHTFTDRKKRWVVTFKSSALTLETARYQGFDNFHERMLRIIDASKEERDSDFFVRVGLRYIDFLPVDQDGLEDWVNRDLVIPLLDGTYGAVKEFWQTVRGETTSGGYTLRHGLRDTAPPQPGGQSGKMNYILDMDFYKEDVEECDVGDLLKSLHDETFRLFAWAIGDKARDHMGWKETGEGDDD
ncbi:MAG: TIGR04255 family protein [Deltaproteobacteria bacterium]|nr:TIGR04255 family protein [Deltaproteobacteria bacterium]